MFDGSTLIPRRKLGLRIATVSAPDWKKVHQAADKYVLRFRYLVMRAVRQAREEAILPEIEAALQTADQVRLMSALQPLVASMERKMLLELPAALMSVMRDSANLVGIPSKPLRTALRMRTILKFNVVNPEALRFVREHAAELVVEIGAATMDAIRAIVYKSFTEGISPRIASKMLLEVIGLTERQAAAVAGLRQRIIDSPGEIVTAGSKHIRVPANGASEEFLERATENYADRLLHYRAEMIARTETMRASNEGQSQMWQQAVEAGLLDGNEMKEWIVTDDDHLCPECEAMSGQQVPISESFPEGDPPLHPNCRCTIGIAAATPAESPAEPVETLESVVEVLGGPGSGNFGHAGRPGEVGGSSTTWEATDTRAFGVASHKKLSKLATGALGEHLTVEYLKAQGFKDARPLNLERNNFPVDLVEDHHVYEVKAGLAGNGPSAQQWRATIGQPGPKETAWLARVKPSTKERWNLKKQEAIFKRKEQAVREVGKRLGHPVKGKTIGLIINPDTRTVDVHVFDGFHTRIGWRSQQAKDGYRGSYRY